MAYEITWDERGVYRRFHGQISDVEVEQSTAMVGGSPRFDELRYSILDFLGVEGITRMNHHFIDEVAAMDYAASLTNPNIRVAIVTDNAEIRALAEEYIGHALRTYPTRIFSTLGDAALWLAEEAPLYHAPRVRLH